jgi:hypothetical protein
MTDEGQLPGSHEHEEDEDEEEDEVENGGESVLALTFASLV